MDFSDIKAVLSFAAFRPDPDDYTQAWARRFAGQKQLLVNFSKNEVTWKAVNRRGKTEDQGHQEGDFMDIIAQRATEWRSCSDGGWVGVSLNSRFIITLESNLPRRKGWEDTIRTNPKALLGPRFDRGKRYGMHHNPETSSSLLLATDESFVRTVEEALKNNGMRPARVGVGLFSMIIDMSQRAFAARKEAAADVLLIAVCDGSVCALRQKMGTWTDLRCRSGLTPDDASAVMALVQPFLQAIDASTRILFMADRPSTPLAADFLPQLSNYHVTDITEPDALWKSFCSN